MVTTVETTEPGEAVPTPVSTGLVAPTRTPGQLLREARFAHDMSEADIANRLHLSRSVIQAIENDAFDKLPGVTFVRGYLRAYARVVELSNEEIMTAFDNVGLEEHMPMLAPVTRVKKDTTAGDSPVRWATYLIILTLVVLVFLWWRGHNEPIDDVVVAPTVTATGEAIATADTQNVSAKDDTGLPVQAIQGNDQKSAIGNKNTTTSVTAGANEAANRTKKSEKVLNSDQLRDKKLKRRSPQEQRRRRRRRVETEGTDEGTTEPVSVASNSNLNDRLNMSGFGTG